MTDRASEAIPPAMRFSLWDSVPSSLPAREDARRTARCGSARESRRYASFLFVLLAACGGATDETADPANGSTSQTPSSDVPQQTPESDDGTPPATAPSECASPATVIATSGSTIRQPVGSVQRFQLVYQGSAVGVAALRGVDMTISGSDGPFIPGKHSGYWAEVRDASGAATFTRLFQDPTRVEAPGNNGGFSNSTVDKCIAKTILVDVPRSPTGSVLVIFGNGYAQGTAAELGRFTLE